MDTVEPEVFTIPSFNMERLIKEVNKLNNRAKKLGFPLMSINVVKQYEMPHPAYVRMFNEGLIKERQIPMIKVSDLTIEGEAIKIEGYELMGTLDHYSIPGSVIVRTVPGQSIPSEFHDRDATCDHCGKKRYRIETFVLQESDTDNYLAVGRQCVRDFIGYDVASLARYLQRWRDLTESFSDEEDERWYGGRYVPAFKKEEVLATTFGAIRVDGWRAKSACAEDETPTSVNVINAFDPPTFMGRGSEQAAARYREWMRKVRESHEEDLVSAQEAIDWLETQEGFNEYMHNLKVLAKAEAIPLNMFGFWCSLAAAYLRQQERLKLAEAERKNRLNEWIGNIKERIELTVTIVTIRAYDGAYGVVNQHRMLDDGGRTLIWWANTNSGMEEGSTYKIKGTVKKHDEYKDWKQTVLSRVAVVEEVETEEAA